MSQNKSAQNSEQTNPKTINNLHQAFAELAFSYGMACRTESSAVMAVSDLAILQADCALLANVAQELKTQIIGGAA